MRQHFWGHSRWDIKFKSSFIRIQILRLSGKKIINITVAYILTKLPVNIKEL